MTSLKSKSTPTLALIGCGAIAEEYYLPVLAKHPAVLEKLILVDRDQARARRLAARFRAARIAADYCEIINAADGVILALPTHLHFPVAMEFLARGTPVLCEKPLAESGEKARMLVEHAYANNVPLAVNYLQRIYPTFARVKELLDARIFGAPRTIQYVVGEEFRWPTVTGFYFNSAASARGILRDRGAHVIDHLCWWLASKPRVISSCNDACGGSEAVAHIDLIHDRCQIQVRLSWLGTTPSTFTIRCERGTIRGDVYDLASLLLQNDSAAPRRVAFNTPIRSKLGAGECINSNFIDVVTQNAQPLIAGRDVLDSIELIDECYAAATRLPMPWYDLPEVRGAA